METRQLEYFVAVAEELSFTRAAQRLYAVQSSVSSAIRSLETELRTTLFDRSTRRVALSQAGQAFLPEAKAALEAVERAKAVLQEATEGLRGSIRIGILTSITVLDLPALLGAFHRRYPLVDIHVSVSVTGSSGLAEDVRHGRLDMALLGLPGTDLAGLRTTVLAVRPFVALLPAGHRLAGRTEIALRDLAGEPFVDTSWGFGNRIVVDRAFDAISAPRRIVIEVSDLTTVPSYVRAGLGVAVVPDLDLEPAPEMVIVPLAGKAPRWEYSLATIAGKQPSRAMQTLLCLIDDHLAEAEADAADQG
ncbi:MAG TPA: LysR family transcriptional regulator [Pseudonocardiaceae bacterium]|jgi:DNA-binding transcriptional LysR family regulator|nr:LysR family transcriptional regulator [Pseudonocardiaceae bacterium]